MSDYRGDPSALKRPLWKRLPSEAVIHSAKSGLSSGSASWSLDELRNALLPNRPSSLKHTEEPLRGLP